MLNRRSFYETFHSQIFLDGAKNSKSKKKIPKRIKNNNKKTNFNIQFRSRIKHIKFRPRKAVKPRISITINQRKVMTIFLAETLIINGHVLVSQALAAHVLVSQTLAAFLLNMIKKLE